MHIPWSPWECNSGCDRERRLAFRSGGAALYVGGTA